MNCLYCFASRSALRSAKYSLLGIEPTQCDTVFGTGAELPNRRWNYRMT